MESELDYFNRMFIGETSFTYKTEEPVIKHQIFKKKVVVIDGLIRELTATALQYTNKKVSLGYSVRILTDDNKEGLSEKIATNRAKSNKIEMVEGKMDIKGVHPKVILDAICTNFIKRVERGSIKIDGIRKK